jgi:hypothetical protein
MTRPWLGACKLQVAILLEARGGWPHAGKAQVLMSMTAEFTTSFERAW